MQRRGLRLAEHFAWAEPAKAYVVLYQRAIQRRKESVARLAQEPT